MIKTVKLNTKRILAICGLVALLLAPSATPASYACSSGASGGAGQCGG